MEDNKLLSIAYWLMNTASEHTGLEYLSNEDLKVIAKHKTNMVLCDEEAALVLTTCRNMLAMHANGDFPDKNDWLYFFEKPLTDKTRIVKDI